MSETTTPPADIDPAKLDLWRLTDAEDLTPDASIRHVLRVEAADTAGDVLDAYDGHHGNPEANPFKLSDAQAAALRGGVAASLEGLGLPPDALCPWLMPAIGEADTPVVVEGEPAAFDPTSAEALAEYDQETARLVMEAEAEVSVLEATWEDKHGEASIAKKEFEGARDKARALTRERAANRGKKDLFTGVKGGIPVGEHPADPAAPSEDRLFELSQLYPLDFAHWEEFGLTAKDVEKLNEGVTKHHGTIPLRTLGDVARYTKPSADGYERRLTDIKGFGPGAFERWEAANLAFWAAWPNGKAAAFAAEIGYDLEIGRAHV